MKNTLKFLESMMIPAMEADDITKRVQRRMRGEIPDTSSTKTDTAQDQNPQPKAMNQSADDNPLTRVDNLTSGLREKDSDDVSSDTNNTSEPTDNNDDTTDNDSSIDDSPIDDGDENDNIDSGADDDTGTDDTTSTTQDDTYMDKNVLRDNLIALYNIISSDVERLTNYSSPSEAPEAVDTINRAIMNLRKCKEITYKLITEKLSTKGDTMCSIITLHIANIRKKSA